jgi:hypothetical protein
MRNWSWLERFDRFANATEFSLEISAQNFRMGKQATRGIENTHSDRLVDSSQDGNASSRNATSVDAYRNGRHVESDRMFVIGEADEIGGRRKSSEVFFAQVIAQLGVSW